MDSLILLGTVSFFVSLFLTPVVRNAFLNWGFVDLPDAKRKLHSQPVPRVGGIPIAVAYAASFGILFLSGLSAGAVVQGSLPMALKLLPAVGLIFAVGLIDDLIGLKPWQKFVGQTAAACMAYAVGVQATNFAGYTFPQV